MTMADARRGRLTPPHDDHSHHAFWRQDDRPGPTGPHTVLCRDGPYRLGQVVDQCPFRVTALHAADPGKAVEIPGRRQDHAGERVRERDGDELGEPDAVPAVDDGRRTLLDEVVERLDQQLEVGVHGGAAHEVDEEPFEISLAVIGTKPEGDRGDLGDPEVALGTDLDVDHRAVGAGDAENHRHALFCSDSSSWISATASIATSRSSAAMNSTML